MNIFILYTILYIITTFGIFLIAALVFLRQGSRENRAFAFFTALLGLWVLLQFVAQLLHETAPILADIALRLDLALPAFFGLEFYRFAQLYTGELSKVKRLAAGQYVLPIIFCIAAFIPGLMYEHVELSYSGIGLTAGWAYYLLVVFVAGYAIFGISKLIMYIHKQANNPAAHYRTRFLLFGIVSAFCIILLAAILFTDAVWSQLTIPVGVFALVSLFGYAIIKHRLFDIRLIAVRLLAYLLSLMAVALLYTLLAFGLFANLLHIGHITVGQEASFVIIALLLALTFAPLKRFFDRATRVIFYQDAYQTQDVLDAVGSIIVSRVEVNKLARESLRVMQTAFKSEFAVVVLVNSESNSIDRTIQVGKVG